MSTREDRYYRKFVHCVKFKGQLDPLIENIQYSLQRGEYTIVQVHMDRIQSLSAELTGKIEKESQ